MASLSSRLLAADGRVPQRFQLSADGCGRATGYAETNKIVTIDGKTQVAWLDSVAEGFRARIRTLDRTIGEWSSTFTLGEAFDNHGGPALTTDSRGFLHVVYYPHHHPFRYRKSKHPNDATDWEEEIQFGQRLTYPSLVCGPDDTLYLSGRRSFSDRPWQVELWSKPAAGDWQGPTIIAKSRYRGYAHFQESLAWSPDNRLLHLSCRFHENSDRSAYGRIQTVGYMVSDDLGTTWRRSDGSLIELPVTAESIEVLDSGGVDTGRILRAGAMAVDAQGTPHVIYSFSDGGRSDTIVATPQGDGRWRRRELSPLLPDEWKPWQLGMPGALTFNCGGEMTVAGTIQRVDEGEEGWGHASSEVVLLTSADRGKTFSFELASQPDPKTAHWLPNIERLTGHNAVPDRPGLIYTAGPPGKKNTDILSNGVFWVG
jgi:hypothetical protein